jgi:hypothetical protein
MRLFIDCGNPARPLPAGNLIFGQNAGNSFVTVCFTSGYRFFAPPFSLKEESTNPGRPLPVRKKAKP